MAYYNVCPVCGANLDPGEPCECRDRKEQALKILEELLTVEADGQMQLREVC